MFPLISGFFPLQQVRLDIKRLIAGLLVVMGVFIPFDMLVTGSFWHFNPEYILGIYLFNLPVEEILFFIVVSYSVTFLWEYLRTPV